MDDQGVSYVGGDFYERLSKRYPGASFISEQISGMMLRSGTERSVFRWPVPVGNAAELSEWQKLNMDRFNLHGSACYCSMFNECKVTDFGRDEPKVVASCQEPTGPRKP